jgi:hypothetical protein
MINGAAALAELVRPAGDVDELGAHRVLPVLPELSGLLPSHGLRRGSTVAVATGRAAPGSGGTSLLLALLAAASRSGSWCAVVGVPSLGMLAAAESGIVLERLALVPNPGPEWPTVVAALIDGVDLVVTAVPGAVSGSIAGRLVARARQRGSVLVPFGNWAGADVTLQVMQGMWEGLGAGRGRLRRREVTVVARGRGAAARPREITMWMPGVSVTPPGPGGAGRPVPDSGDERRAGGAVAPSGGPVSMAVVPERAGPVAAVPERAGPVAAVPERAGPVAAVPARSPGSAASERVGPVAVAPEGWVVAGPERVGPVAAVPKAVGLRKVIGLRVAFGSAAGRRVAAGRVAAGRVAAGRVAAGRRRVWLDSGRSA